RGERAPAGEQPVTGPVRALLHSASVDGLQIVGTAGAIAIAVAALIALRRERRTAHASGMVRGEEVADLRDRLEASEAERDSEATILASMEEGGLLFGPDGHTRLANQAAELHLGGRPSSIDALLPLGLQRIAPRAAEDRATIVAA